MRPRLAPVAALLAIAVAAPAAAFVLVTTPDDRPIAWRHRCVEAWLHTALPPALSAADTYSALDEAVAAWNAVPCTWLRGAERGFTCFDDVGLAFWPGPQDVVLWHSAPHSWQHAYRVVALTSVTYDLRTGEIVDADIEMNGEDYAFAIDGRRDAYDLVQTLTHELGHVYGLDHTPVPDATMFALSYAGEIAKRTLHPDDVAGLCASHPLSSAPGGSACQIAAAAPWEAPWCPVAPEPGCSAAGPLAPAALLALLALRALRRRRAP